MAYEDEWETGSGLQLDGATATITAMEFGYNASIGAGVTCANLTLEMDDGEEIEQSFSTGGRNEPSRDGKILEGSGKINKRSNFGMLIESIKEVVDDPAETIGRVRDVEGWIGTTWKWGTVERETTNPTTGEVKVSSKFIVTDYLGRKDAKGGKGGTKGKGKAAKGKGKAAKAKATKAEDKDDDAGDDTGDDSSDLFAHLVELAAKYDDHDEFVDDALEVEGVSENRELQRAVMKTTEGSVWAAAGKS